MRDVSFRSVAIAGAVCGALLLGWAAAFLVSSLSVEGEAGNRYGRLTIEYVEGDVSERVAGREEAGAAAPADVDQHQADVAAEKTGAGSDAEGERKTKAPEPQTYGGERVATENLSVAVASVDELRPKTWTPIIPAH